MWIVIAIITSLVLGGIVGRKSGNSSGNRESKTKKPANTQTSIKNKDDEIINVVKVDKKKKAKIESQLPENLIITEEFQAAIDLMEQTNKSAFITGKAGTGKSTLLRYFQTKTKKNHVVLAPTGIAAINVQGQTIHSFFKFPPRLIKEEDIRTDNQKRDLFEALEMIIIDEISMVRVDLLEGINLSLQKYRNNKLPFGGIQMLFFGDLYQLPPVVADDASREYFETHFKSPYFFSLPALGAADFSVIELNEIFRQKDPEFIRLLNNIRVGRFNHQDLVSLNKRVVHGFQSGKDDMFITLASTNKIADSENARRLEHINSHSFEYRAKIEGYFEKSAYPTNEILELKKDAQIMMLKNDSGRKWVNGTIGSIKDLSKDKIKVEINGEVYEVLQEKWEVIEYEYNREERKIEPIVKGSFTQYPLKLAWAVTIHKSQGKTFDQVVIDLGNGAFAHGQTYVAISRCTSFEGIILKQPIRSTDVIVDDRVVEFMKQANS